MTASEPKPTSPIWTIALPEIPEFVKRASDWKPWHPHCDECPFRNVSMETMQICSALAKRVPSQSPKAVYVPRGERVDMIVGDEVFDRPAGEPLVDFLMDHLKGTFGQEWADRQLALPEDARHAVMRWCFSLHELQNASIPKDHKPGEWFQVIPTGDAMEFMSLAHDLYQLRLVRALRPKLINRLRHHQEFQGARYETAIAASFVRAGFDIVWESGDGTKCEFVATQRLTGEAIAIEVKSRHRQGTLNEPGTMPARESLRFDVKHLYDKALSQCPKDKPCGIFIDLNLPTESAADPSGIPWWQGIRELLDERPQPTAAEPAVETFLILTNFGWHYVGKAEAQGSRYVDTYPEFVRHRLTNPNTFIAIVRAMDTYGKFPMTE